MRALAVLAIVLGAASAAAAQDAALARADLPWEVERRIRALYEDSATVRYTGPAGIGAGVVVAHNVVVEGGPFTLSGRVEGDLVVLEGDLELRPGAEVTGDVWVIGGEAHGFDQARIDGALTVYGEGFGDRVRRRVTGRRGPRVVRYADDGAFGHARFSVRTGTNYNRVEGLPILFGPVVRTAGEAPTRMELLGIWRTERGLDADDLGYSARLEQYLDPSRRWRVGASAYSTIDPIERWGVTDLEASLSTFLLHDDLRDYFERTGWSAYVRFTPRALPIDAVVEYRTEDHDLVAVEDPWTLFGDDDWRAQPLVATGAFRSVSGRVEYDSRNSRRYPVEGWYASGTVQRGLGGSLVLPALQLAPGVVIPAMDVDEEFTTGLVDVRRYNRAGREATLGLRVVAGGALAEETLPPQFQHALGGAGSLPGHDHFGIDCGARGLAGTIANGDGTGQVFQRGYGCDRFALFQAEYRGGIDLEIELFDHSLSPHRDRGVDLDLGWSVFFDVGQGWTYAGSARGDTGVRYDAGFGLLFGDLGVYWAIPLERGERRPNFFIRLGPRF